MSQLKSIIFLDSSFLTLIPFISFILKFNYYFLQSSTFIVYNKSTQISIIVDKYILKNYYIVHMKIHTLLMLLGLPFPLVVETNYSFLPHKSNLHVIQILKNGIFLIFPICMTPFIIFLYCTINFSFWQVLFMIHIKFTRFLLTLSLF